MAISWRRVALLLAGLVTVVLAIMGVGLLAQRYPSFLLYKVAVLGNPGPGDRLLTLMSREWEKEHRLVRLAPTPGDIAGNAGRLSAGEADMAIVRGDDPIAQGLRMVFRLQTLGVMVLLPPESAIETGADMKGRKLALLGAAPPDDRLLQTVLKALGIDDAHVQPFEAQTLGPAMRSGHISAAIMLVPLSIRSPLVIEAVQSIAKSYRRKPSFLDLSEATAIASAHPLYSAEEVTPAIFGAAVADPSETINAPSVSLLLAARPDMPNRVAGEIAGALVALRTRLLASEPGIAQIAPPDLEVVSGVAVHPGVIAYLNGDQPSIAAEAINLYWIAGGVVAVLSPLLALVLGWLRTEPADPAERRLSQVMRLMAAAKTSDPAEARRIEADLGRIMGDSVHALAKGEIEAEDFLCIEAVIRHAAAGINDRQREKAA